jgi:hypothetical protein
MLWVLGVPIVVTWQRSFYNKKNFFFVSVSIDWAWYSYAAQLNGTLARIQYIIPIWQINQWRNAS